MFSKKQLVLISFVLAILFHFIFYFSGYGPYSSYGQHTIMYLPAVVSALVMIFIYFFTYWRRDLADAQYAFLFDLLVAWILICFVRSVIEMRSIGEMIPFLFYNYLGISLFPVFFFMAGIRPDYYVSINKMLTFYIFLGTLVSLLFINYFELQIFLLMPLFYIVLTIPFRSSWGKIIILIITITVILVSVTNRAGILRLIISYSILLTYFLMRSVRISKKLITFMVFVLLLIPLISLYFGLKGESVFQFVLGEDTQPYSQMNPYADTRTFLYYEVFQDLKLNNAFVFGKGLNATYASQAFQTFGRPMVEVGFLQILLKTGIVGVVLYLAVIIIAIIKSIGKSSSIHLKSLGLLLLGYVLMLFIENVVAYNLLNAVIWIIVGICYSPKMRALKDSDFSKMFSEQIRRDRTIDKKTPD